MPSLSLSSTFSLFNPATELPSLTARRRSIYLHRIRVSASIPHRNLTLSWLPNEQQHADVFNGWGIVQLYADNTNKKELGRYVVGGVAVSVAVLVAVVAHFSLCRKGFRYPFFRPLESIQGVLGLIKTEANKVKTLDFRVSHEDDLVSGTSPGSKDKVRGSVSPDILEADDKSRRFMIPSAVDSSQLEALHVLKKLKIIEDNVEAAELCSRREYARWLVRLNSMLERNLKHRIAPLISFSGSPVAFDDVNTKDPDFLSIQALAEAGIVPSILSGNMHVSDGSAVDGGMCFFPERLLSRQDMIDWKAQLEYEITPGMMEQISKTKLDYMDAREIGSNASPELFQDMLTGENSILRKVFGQSKRFQPKKPSTKAQVAVALASGRMTDAIQSELSKLEAENLSQLAAMDEIKNELLERGYVTKFWDEKLQREKRRGVEVEKDYYAAVEELKLGKIDLEKSYAEYLKERAALDCQKQLLLSLKEEIGEMSDRLKFEMENYESEHLRIENTLCEVQNHLQGLLDKKSILESENEAIRILRTWIEDEARKNQACAKVLEEVGQRWKWSDQP